MRTIEIFCPVADAPGPDDTSLLLFAISICEFIICWSGSDHPVMGFEEEATNRIVTQEGILIGSNIFFKIAAVLFCKSALTCFLFDTLFILKVGIKVTEKGVVLRSAYRCLASTRKHPIKNRKEG
jgi:hypothetical protein